MCKECGKRSIALENIQKIADTLEIEIYKLFVDDVVLVNHDKLKRR